jgi:hypothetical protein
MNFLTTDQVAQALPPNLKGAATDELTDKINNILLDPIMAEEVRNNFISYTKVLQEGKFKTEDYLNAVIYVSHKLTGMTNQDAYAKTFPDRMAEFIAKGTSLKDISSYVSMYNKGKLVNLILQQTLVPTWVLNADVYQKAINTQADLMINAQSELVRTQAANSLLTHLTKPKETGPLINLDLRDTSGMEELKNLLRQTAQSQRDAILAGVPAKQIAEQSIIDVESTRVP